ncbi:MAG: translation initiation factor IF-3 [Proteobacteria bacterium]|nr:translation initiation factor IF-3 [Pseudomonadota bacterium]
MARQFRRGPPKPTGPKANDQIEAEKVRLIDHEGNNRGIVELEEALAVANEVGLDLVEISPNAEPPVCKVLDYGKYKYEAQKKAAESRKHQKTQEVKEIKMRPGIDIHDYEVKMRSVNRFLETGDKVKVTMRFRGREMAHQELGMAILERVREQTEDLAKVETMPLLEGRQMTMVLAPK